MYDSTSLKRQPASRLACAAVAVAATLAASWSNADAQTTRADTVFLAQLQRAAEMMDRRGPQMEYLTQQTALRMQTIRNERLPSLSGNASVQYLSDVASVSSVLGGALPGGVQIPSPYHDQYDASVTARQPLFDATRSKRIAVEDAQLNEAASRVRVAIWQSHELVNQAFFALRLYDAQQQSLDAAIVDLTARRDAAQKRASAGSALPSEVLLIDAEIVKRQQTKREMQVQREATRVVLGTIVGHDVPPDALLAVQGEQLSLPTVDDAATLRARREYENFQRMRETITARTAELSVRDLPRVNAFGRVGYGRPGLNALGRSFDTYWNAGVQLEWSPLNWGRTKRELQVQAMQTQIVNSEEAAFSESVKRTALTQRAQVAALEQSLAMDDSIISLRDRVLRETRLRFDEGEITSAEYIARQTEYLTSQLERDTRRVRVSEARARYFTTIGREVR